MQNTVSISVSSHDNLVSLRESNGMSEKKA